MINDFLVVLQDDNTFLIPGIFKPLHCEFNFRYRFGEIMACAFFTNTYSSLILFNYYKSLRANIRPKQQDLISFINKQKYFIKFSFRL